MRRFLPASPRGVLRAVLVALVLGLALGGWNKSERELNRQYERTAAVESRNNSLIIVAGMLANSKRQQEIIAGKFDGKAHALERQQIEDQRRLESLERTTRLQRKELQEMRGQQDFRESKGWTGQLEAN